MRFKDFDASKSTALFRLEGAEQSGQVDAGVRELVMELNRHPDYYTTSSCSGRIVVSQASPENYKSAYVFLGKWHREVTFQEVMDAIEEHDAGVLYFRVEPLILHVAARDASSADALLDLCRGVGLKRSGIIHLLPRIIIEVQGVDMLQVPLGREGVVLVSDAYVEWLTMLGNLKYRHNAGKLERFREGFVHRFHRGGTRV